MTQPVRRTFPGRLDQVACAREFVKTTIGCCPVRDEAVLLTSELCTNTLQHTASGRGGSFEVTVHRGLHALRVEVRDDGSETVPAVRNFGEFAQDGRGLELVQLIASRWGQHGDEYGRSVFFELRWNGTPPSTAPASSGHLNGAQADGDDTGERRTGNGGKPAGPSRERRPARSSSNLYEEERR